MTMIDTQAHTQAEAEHIARTRAIIPALREQYPGLKIFVSTTTITGQQIARTRLQDVDAVFFFLFGLFFFGKQHFALNVQERCRHQNAGIKIMVRSSFRIL